MHFRVSLELLETLYCQQKLYLIRYLRSETHTMNDYFIMHQLSY
jgi:hypothetical protein